MFLMFRYKQEYEGCPTAFDGLVSFRWTKAEVRLLIDCEIERLQARHHRGRGWKERRPVIEELEAPPGIIVRKRATFRRSDNTVAGIYVFDIHKLPVEERIHPRPEA